MDGPPVPGGSPTAEATRSSRVDQPHAGDAQPRDLLESRMGGDGCLGFRFGDRLRLLSRNGKLLNETYPEVVDALSRQHCDDFVVDGEVVAFEGAFTSFSPL